MAVYIIGGGGAGGRGHRSGNGASDASPDLHHLSHLFPDHPGFARDVSAVANTQVDWKETPQAHIFKANLPGKNLASSGCILFRLQRRGLPRRLLAFFLPLQADCLRLPAFLAVEIKLTCLPPNVS
jgi:hypothetical protein